MNVEPHDPRDTSWELDEPAYRVCFWHRQSEGSTAGWVVDEWRLSDVDVTEVLAWAEERAEGRRITISVEHDCDRSGLGMIRLHG